MSSLEQILALIVAGFACGLVTGNAAARPATMTPPTRPGTHRRTFPRRPSPLSASGSGSSSSPSDSTPNSHPDSDAAELGSRKRKRPAESDYPEKRTRIHKESINRHWARVWNPIDDNGPAMPGSLPAATDMEVAQLEDVTVVPPAPSFPLGAVPLYYPLHLSPQPEHHPVAVQFPPIQDLSHTTERLHPEPASALQLPELLQVLQPALPPSPVLAPLQTPALALPPAPILAPLQPPAPALPPSPVLAPTPASSTGATAFLSDGGEDDDFDVEEVILSSIEINLPETSWESIVVEVDGEPLPLEVNPEPIVVGEVVSFNWPAEDPQHWYYVVPG
ncbi:hypothetical protein FA95DRAFT_1225549 [Auriscalpium vulgare]|uniref:Uncharacterized protein n=1 Tax=Auriscalpium vulgare TaxID=40419 RepID=A0ACB8RU46_9AGAM|nr:hypothetical protein FA95DRAFT_1225549 [Auriscalpium vulgare]